MLELIKTRSKVHEKNKSHEIALNFEQCKIFPENYKPIRVRTWLVYKITENNCRLRLFAKLIFIIIRCGINIISIKFLS